METNTPKAPKVQLQYDWPQLKGSTIASLLRYRDERIPTGGFLRAVLENDLNSSFAHADRENRESLHDIVQFCRSELPALCWGSPAKVHDWLIKADLADEDKILRDTKTGMWFVRFKGQLQAAAFEEMENADAHLKRLQSGEEQSDPYHWDVKE